MTRIEKLFFIAYGMIFFPLLLIFLVMHRYLDKSLVTPFLTFMASINGVYLGARGFDNWNSTPDNVEGSRKPDDDEGH